MVSVAIRLRLGKIPSSKLKASGLWPLAFASSLAPVPSGRRLSSGRPDARQLILSVFLAARRINRVLTKKNRFRSAGAASRPSKWSAVSVEVRGYAFPYAFQRFKASSDALDRPGPKPEAAIYWGTPPLSTAPFTKLGGISQITV